MSKGLMEGNYSEHQLLFGALIRILRSGEELPKVPRLVASSLWHTQRTKVCDSSMPRTRHKVAEGLWRLAYTFKRGLSPARRRAMH